MADLNNIVEIPIDRDISLDTPMTDPKKLGEGWYMFKTVDDYLKAGMIFRLYDGLQEDFEHELENIGIVFFRAGGSDEVVQGL